MSERKKSAWTGIARVLTPSFVVSLYYFMKFKAKISPKAEVEMSPKLHLGNDCHVGSFAKIKATDGVLKIGNRGRIAVGAFIDGGKGTTIGDNFIAGPHVHIVAANYSYSKKGVHLEDMDVISKGITIGDHVWLGAGVTVTDGAEIGDNTIVVANSLVTRKFPADVVLQGNPAKIIARR
ncbi:acyltransferase [Erythrobacter sp. HA6-11]